MERLEDITRTFKSAPEKIKAFLRRQRWKQALIFFFFVLLALGFWMLQSLQQDYEIELSFPVRYKNVPPEMAFTPLPPKEIKVKVKDKGSVLLNYTFGRKFIPIEVDVKGLTAEGGEFKVAAKNIESDILKQLLSSTLIESVDPATIVLKYAPQKKMEIPVVFYGEIRPEAGFFLSDSITLKPAQVEVYASTTILDTLKYIRTEWFEIENATRPLSHLVNLQKIEGATFVPDAVMLTATIEEFTEKTLEIPIDVPDLPGNLILRTFPPQIKVTCNVPLSRFKELEGNDIVLHIRYADLEHDTTGYTPVHIVKKPDWVKRIMLTPDKVEFILEQNNATP